MERTLRRNSLGTTNFARNSADVVAQNGWLRPLLWLTLATSSYVVVEPAPYDLLLIGLAVCFFSTGLKVPGALGSGALLLAIFLIGNLAGTLTGGHGDDSVRALSIRIYMLFAWLLFASVVAERPDRNMRIIWSGYVCAALIAVVWGVGQYYALIPGELTGPTRRATGGFKDANVFAPFLVPIALLSLAHVYHARGARLLVTIGCFLLLNLGILVAFSRGAWLNLLASCGFLCLLLLIARSPRRQKLNFVLMLVVVVTAGFAALFLAVNYTDAGQMFAQRSALVQAYDVAAGGRFDSQLRAIELIGQTPLGAGAGMADEVLGIQPHNIYLQVTLEGGWLAGISFVGFLGLTIVRGLRHIRRPGQALDINVLVALAGLLGVLLQSAFIDSTHWRHMWLLIAIVWGLTATQTRPLDRSH